MRICPVQEEIVLVQGHIDRVCDRARGRGQVKCYVEREVAGDIGYVECVVSACGWLKC